VLARHPKGKLTSLFAEVEEDEEILRVKPILLAEVLAAMGDYRDREGKPEAGVREFLTGQLSSPEHCVDAARALGALHDEAAVPALLAFLRNPRPEDEDDATGGGLGFLGRSTGARAETAAAESLRHILVGAIALLRSTAK
jgi:PBS lyase HEAT-like repeat-containing protein